MARVWKDNNLKTLSWKLSLASTVYNIWFECNFRLHNSRTNSVAQISEKIFESVKLKLSLPKEIQDTAGNRVTQLLWNLPVTIFDK